MGRRLIPLLLARGHEVTALTRSGSAYRLSVPPVPSAPSTPSTPSALDAADTSSGTRKGTLRIAPGNALDPLSLKDSLGDCDTWVQLIGTPKPSPWKAAQFRAVDFRAVTASLEALAGSRIRHYVYLSVAQPSPMMRAYVQVRTEAEALLRETDLALTFLRPWYVLGPGHRWPAVLSPIYKLLEIIPSTREGALRFGLVTLERMLAALVDAVENPPSALRILDVTAIRAGRPADYPSAQQPL